MNRTVATVFPKEKNHTPEWVYVAIFSIGWDLVSIRNLSY